MLSEKRNFDFHNEMGFFSLNGTEFLRSDNT